MVLTLMPLRMLSLALVLCAGCTSASAKDPRVPPGRDPGGVPVALISTGIDYTDPDVAKRLARDGEGEVLGWDFFDHDNRPFDVTGGQTPANWGGDGTALAKLIAQPGVRIVPVRITPADPVSLAQAVAFIARTPARVVVLPMWSGRKSDWEPFRQAAMHFSELLFFVPAGDEGKDIDFVPVWPAALSLPNIVVVSSALSGPRSGAAPNTGSRSIDALVTASRQMLVPGGEPAAAPADTRAAAALAADALVRCWPQLPAFAAGEPLKAAFLAASSKSMPGAPRTTIERCVSNAAAPR